MQRSNGSNKFIFKLKNELVILYEKTRSKDLQQFWAIYHKY